MLTRRQKRKQAEVIDDTEYSYTDENQVPVPPSPFKKMSKQFDEFEDSVNWPSRVEEAFIRMMVDEVQKNPVQTSSFNNRVWQKIDEQLFNLFGKRYTVQKLKTKYSRLKMKYREFKTLLGPNVSGFGWDPETNTVTATEDVWQRHLQTRPKARQFRRKGCEHYNLLCIIFNNTNASGSLARSSSQLPPNSDEERDLEEEFMGGATHDIHNIGKPDDSPLAGKRVSNSGKRAASGQLSGKASKCSKMSSMDIALEAFTDFANARKKQIEGNTTAVEASSNLKDRYSIQACMDALNSFEDVDYDQYIKATKSFSDGDWRVMFIEMRASMKLKWVQSL